MSGTVAEPRKVVPSADRCCRTSGACALARIVDEGREDFGAVLTTSALTCWSARPPWSDTYAPITRPRAMDSPLFCSQERVLRAAVFVDGALEVGQQL